MFRFLLIIALLFPTTILANNKDFKIGFILPLSSEDNNLKAIAQQMVNSAILAMYDLDFSLDKKGKNLNDLYKNKYSDEIEFYDNKGTKQGSIDAINKAIADGVSIVVGPLTYDNTMAVLPTAKKVDIAVISLSNNSDLANSGALIMGYMPENQLRRAVNYATGQEIYKYTLFLPKRKLGSAIKNEMLQIVKDYNWLGDLSPSKSLEVLNIVEYDKFDNDFIASIGKATKATKDNHGFIFVDGGLILSDIAQYIPSDKNIQIIGSGLWYDIKTIGLPQLKNSIFASPSLKDTEEFQINYFKQYNHLPAIISAIAYDAVATAYIIHEREGSENLSTQDFIQQVGFSGISGSFRFKINGLIDRLYPVIAIKNGKFKEVESAPKLFSEK